MSEISPNPYLIDPGQRIEDDRSRALIALDGLIKKDPVSANEVVADSLIVGSTLEYDLDTPHAHIAAAIDEALTHTNNGVALFNGIDPESFDEVINNPVYTKQSGSRRRENPNSAELARHAALTGLGIYINRHF